MKFKTQYDDHERVISNPGNRMKAVYKMRLDEKGKQVLEKTSEFSLYDEIQSHYDETEIHALIDRYKLTGDPSLLNKVQGQFGDFTDVPKTLADTYRFVQDANNYFEMLPIDVRREYNFNAAEFFSDIGSEKWTEVVKKYKLRSDDVPSVVDLTNPDDAAATIEMLQNQIATAQEQLAQLEGGNTDGE